MVRESSHTHHLHARAVGSALVYSNRPAGSNSARRRALRVEELIPAINPIHYPPHKRRKRNAEISLARRSHRPTRSRVATHWACGSRESMQSNQCGRVAARRSCRSWRYTDRFKGVSRHARITKAFHQGPRDLIVRIRCCSPPPCVYESVHVCVCVFVCVCVCVCVCVGMSVCPTKPQRGRQVPAAGPTPSRSHADAETVAVITSDLNDFGP